MTSSSRFRRGYSLLEVMIVIVVGTALLSLLGAVVSRMIAMNAAAGEHLHDVATLGALGQQFRRDVHGTAKVEAAPDAKNQTLILTLDDGSLVEYQAADGHLRRTHTVSGQPTSREIYAFNVLRVLGWKETSAINGEIALAIGRMDRSATGDTRPSRQFDIVGVVGGRGDATTNKPGGDDRS